MAITLSTAQLEGYAPGAHDDVRLLARDAAFLLIANRLGDVPDNTENKMLALQLVSLYVRFGEEGYNGVEFWDQVNTLFLNMGWCPGFGEETSSLSYLFYVQETAPDNPLNTTLWVDLSVDPPVWKRWDGSAWIEIGGGAGGGISLSRLQQEITTHAGMANVHHTPPDISTKLNSITFNAHTSDTGNPHSAAGYIKAALIRIASNVWSTIAGRALTSLYARRHATADANIAVGYLGYDDGTDLLLLPHRWTEGSLVRIGYYAEVLQPFSVQRGEIRPSQPVGFAALYSEGNTMTLLVDRNVDLWQVTGGMLPNTIAVLVHVEDESDVTTISLNKGGATAQGVTTYSASGFSFAVGQRYIVQFKLGGVGTAISLHPGSHMREFVDENSLQKRIAPLLIGEHENVRTWNAADTFLPGEFVYFGTHIYFKYTAGASVNESPISHPDIWHYIGEPRVYSNAVTYKRGDVVIGSDNKVYVNVHADHHSINPVTDTSGRWHNLSDAPAGGTTLTGSEIAALLTALTGNDRLSYDVLKDKPDIPTGGGSAPSTPVVRSRVGHLDSVAIASGGVNLITLTEDVVASADYQVEVTDDASGMTVTSVKIPGELILAKTDLASTPANLANALLASILTTRFGTNVAFDNNAVSRWNVLKGTSDRTLFLVNANGSNRANTVEVWKYPRTGSKGDKGDQGDPAAAGTARGDLIAHTTGTFPTGTIAYGSAINGVTWELNNNPVPPALVVLRSLNLTIQPTANVSLPAGAIGLWFVAETVTGGVSTEIGIPTLMPLHSFRNDNNETRPILLLSASQRLTIANQMRDAGMDAHGFLPRGGGTAVPANLRLSVYWAIGVGPKGDSGYGDVYMWWAKGAANRYGDAFPNKIDPVSNRARLEFKDDAPNEKFHTTANPASWWVANPANLDSTGAPATSTPRVVFQPPAGTWKLSLQFKMDNGSINAGMGLFEAVTGSDREIVVSQVGVNNADGFASAQVAGRVESDEIVTDGTRQFYYMGRWTNTVSVNYYLRAEKIG